MDFLTFDDCKTASDGSHVQVCCPFCEKRVGKPDTKYHLYINVTNTSKHGCWICHRCGAKGLSFNGVKERPEEHRDWASLLGGKSLNEEARDLGIDFPCETHVVSGFTPVALNYLLSRGLSTSDISDYGIRVGMGGYSNRIFFPDFSEKGDLLYWVARNLSPKARAKYENPKCHKSSKVHYLSRVVAEGHHSVVITEGVISAIRAGRNAVAVYGKGYSRAQVNLLADAGFSEYYVALDGDAFGNLLSLFKSLKSLGKSARMVILPYQEDPASVTDFQGWLNEAVEDDLGAMTQKLSTFNYRSPNRVGDFHKATMHRGLGQLSRQLSSLANR